MLTKEVDQSNASKFDLKLIKEAAKFSCIWLWNLETDKIMKTVGGGVRLCCVLKLNSVKSNIGKIIFFLF